MRGTTEAQDGGVPLWERRYVHFPRLLSVLTGTGQAGFAHRANDLELIAHTRYVAKMLRTVPAMVAKLEDLEDEGPSSDVWWSIADLEAGPGPWWS
ncbi:hypothetical protein ACWC9T_41450 [Kitasatospora sp. NPDC001159]